MKFLDLLYRLDEERTQLLRNGRFEDFANTYKTEVNKQNINTPKFWTNLLLKDVSNKDHMMMDRLNIVSKLVSQQKGSVLNIGVGKGKLEEKLNKLDPNRKIFGLDITLPGLHQATKTGKFAPICGSITELPIKSGSIKIITILEVLEHLYYDQIFSVLKSVKNKLTSDGTLIISVPINENYSSKHNPNGHLRRYSKEIILEELRLSGFQADKIIELYAFSKQYYFKKFLTNFKYTNRWKPNDLIIVARKQ